MSTHPTAEEASRSEHAGRDAAPRDLAPVDEVLRTTVVVDLLKRFPRELVVDAARAVLDRLRREILAGGRHLQAGDVTVEKVGPWVVALVEESARPSLRRVINALGVVGHTNLGRSLLADDAVRAVAAAAAFYSDLEIDLASGERGSRQAHVHDILCMLSGAEDALVVNNNAAAILLALAATARHGEVLVSRGQLVEIGDGFRIPDILRESGAELVEVGTTNRTYLRDFEAAWTDRTRAVLRVHTSNYRIVGFAGEPSLDELAGLAHDRGAVLLDDLGSGALLRSTAGASHSGAGAAGSATGASGGEGGAPGLSLLGEEPPLHDSVSAGADVVTFSGDKLLGGPQAGIAVGRAATIEAMRRHPLARAVRIDKLGVAALDATLRLYLDPARAAREVPTLAMLAASRDEVAERAARLGQEVFSRAPAAGLPAGWPAAGDLEVVDSIARAGAGSLPVTDVPSAALAVRPPGGDAEQVSRSLRLGDPAVLARVQEGRLLLDLRAVRDEEVDDLAAALVRALA